jgi:hypothetical protein
MNRENHLFLLKGIISFFKEQHPPENHRSRPEEGEEVYSWNFHPFGNGKFKWRIQISLFLKPYYNNRRLLSAFHRAGGRKILHYLLDRGAAVDYLTDRGTSKWDL